MSKNTANRALSVLCAAGLVEPIQTRSSMGRFEAGRYRLVVAFRRSSNGSKWSGSACRELRRPVRCRGRGRTRAFGSSPPVGAEQLSLLPGI